MCTNNFECQQFLKDSADYFRGGLEMVDNMLPDGAYFAAISDTTEYLLGCYQESFDVIPPKHVTSDDVVHHFLEGQL